ncbi:SMP-30/gluconolactonase/LRE family protein [Nonomuraea sp. NPDC050451]|uniref:SMP-30/gluconolactonase/LRE family protein n=1 Tax=Nonomuraea sp. NPDC050451 TaxID=3364364 RepID=UPI0037BE1CDA
MGTPPRRGDDLQRHRLEPRRARLRPGGGHDLTVEVPATDVTSCAFGGPDLDVLFVTTAWDGRTGGELRRCRTAFTGLPANPYRDLSP